MNYLINKIYTNGFVLFLIFRLLPVQWAQRKDNLYVTIPLRDFKEDKIIMNEKTIEIKGTSDNRDYQTTLNLMSEIVPSESKYQINGFSVQILLSKKDKEASYWPRLVEEKKANHITVDWNKYIDEDDEA